MVRPALLARVRADLDFWEQPILWMYLDSVGLVTVGCGTQLKDASAAQKVGFFHEKTGVVASQDEIKTAWDHLHDLSPAQKLAKPHDKNTYNFYKSKTDLRITPDTASLLRDSHIMSDYGQLKRIYLNFDLLPEDAQLALFDMIYNLGPGRPRTKKHKATGLRNYAVMNDAINRGDWEAAAFSCNRSGIPVDRNRQTALLFRRAGESLPAVKL